MKNEFTITAKSPEEARIMAIQITSGALSFHADEAIYVHNMADSIADFGRFPLVIEGTIACYPVLIKIANINIKTASELLRLFGFKEPLRESQEDRFYKVFRNFD